MTNRIITDMLTAHEGHPNVNPSFSWYSFPTINMGVNPHASALSPSYPGIHYEDWPQIIPWSVIIRQKDAAEPSNTRVNTKDHCVYVWSIARRKWYAVQISHGHVGGQFDKEDYSTATAITRRIETDGTSSYIPPLTFSAQVYSDKIGYDINDIGGVFACISHKLVLNDKFSADTRSTDKWLVNCGADYWPPVGQPLGTTTVPGVGVGRFLFAGPEWRTSTFCALGTTYDWDKDIFPEDFVLAP